MPSMVVETNAQWKIANDKSSILIKGQINENGDYVVADVKCNRHAIHIQRHPALGGYALEVVTPDDGVYALKLPAKNKLDKLEELPYHYRVFIVRIDLP